LARSARSKTIKVSDKEWELIKKARKALERQGYADIEDDLEEYIDDDDEDSDFLAGLALGAVAAVGAAAVIKWLSQKDQK